jgi:hypothetical protein
VLADIRQFAQDDPVFSRPLPLVVDVVESGVTLQSLNLAA